MTSVFPIKIRFRPECQADAEKLFEIRGGSDRFVSITPEPPAENAMARTMFFTGEREWEIEIVSDGDMTDLIASMLEVPDGHRMLQTVDVAEHFTGEAFDGAEERSQRIVALMPNATAGLIEAYQDQVSPASPPKNG